jgi:hypothetical protein
MDESVSNNRKYKHLMKYAHDDPELDRLIKDRFKALHHTIESTEKKCKHVSIVIII